MRIQQRNQLEISLQLIISMLHFVPGAMVFSMWKRGENGRGWSRLLHTNELLSFYDVTRRGGTNMEAYAAIGLPVIIIGFIIVALCTVQILSKGKWKNTVWVPIAAVVQVGLYFVYTQIRVSNWDPYYSGGNQFRLEYAPLSYAHIALMLMLVLVSIIGYIMMKRELAEDNAQ